MNSSGRKICVLIFLVALSFSCKKNSTPPLSIDESYFPLTTGKYIIYDVDSVGYWGFQNTIIHSTYQIKEEVDSPFIDNAGNEAYRIIRSRRSSDSANWLITDVWSANLTDHTAEKVEENLRFVKLDFPVQLNKQWYGNTYIETDSAFEWLDGWKYEYTSVNEPDVLNGISFDSTLIVTQNDDENVIEKTIFIEKYAKNVGMIYKIEEQLETQPLEPPNGYVVEMTVKEFN